MSPGARERLAAHLRSLRVEAGLSQAELAARSGVDQSAISFLERGRRRPTRKTMTRLAKALGVSLKALVPEESA